MAVVLEEPDVVGRRVEGPMTGGREVVRLRTFFEGNFPCS